MLIQEEHVVLGEIMFTLQVLNKMLCFSGLQKKVSHAGLL